MFCAAVASYQAGRLAECRDHLLQVQLRGFTRLQWYVECNLLACRMKESDSVLQDRLRSGEGLQDVLCSYERLWKKMNGVSPTRESVCVELCVVLGVCQLLVLLSHWNRVIPYMSTVVERVANVLSPESPTLPSISDILATMDDRDIETQAMMRCVRKMRVLQALVEAEEGREGVGDFSQAIALHSMWLGGDERESCYRQAWLQYSSGDYQSALVTLSSPPLSSTSTPLSPLCHLLCGACYAKQAQPQLALLHWKKSMETDYTPHHFLPALQNCALVYGEDQTAAMATRRMEIETLKCLPECDQTILPMWVWLDDKVGRATAHISHRSLVEASYNLAWQGMKGHRYELASEAVQECISAVENGVTVQVPPSLPPPSTLHLLRAHCVVCGAQDMRRGKALCEELICSAPLSMPPLWRSEVMCILATACLLLGECAESRQWSLKCLEAVETAVRTVANPSSQSCLLLIQQHVQHLLALGAIAHAQWREALQLLASVLATPTGLYNHCLLQCRVGVVMGGATGWLDRRGKLPAERHEARQWLREGRESLDQTSDTAMDLAMLSLWLQHNTQHKQ